MVIGWHHQKMREPQTVDCLAGCHRAEPNCAGQPANHDLHSHEPPSGHGTKLQVDLLNSIVWLPGLADTITAKCSTAEYAPSSVASGKLTHTCQWSTGLPKSKEQSLTQHALVHRLWTHHHSKDMHTKVQAVLFVSRCGLP